MPESHEAFDSQPAPIVEDRPEVDERRNFIEVVVNINSMEARSTVYLPADIGQGQDDERRAANELAGRCVDAISSAVHGKATAPDATPPATETEPRKTKRGKA